MTWPPCNRLVATLDDEARTAYYCERRRWHLGRHKAVAPLLRWVPGEHPGQYLLTPTLTLEGRSEVTPEPLRHRIDLS